MTPRKTERLRSGTRPGWQLEREVRDQGFIMVPGTLRNVPPPPTLPSLMDALPVRGRQVGSPPVLQGCRAFQSTPPCIRSAARACRVPWIVAWRLAEQLLLHVGFMETVKLHSIDFVAPADGESGPSLTPGVPRNSSDPSSARHVDEIALVVSRKRCPASADVDGSASPVGCA